MIPSLPTEIIREIILFSLPPFKQTNYRERYDLLLAYSLVDELWKIIAQDELMKHVFIKNLNKLISIDSEFIRKEKVGLISKVRSIRLDANSVADEETGELSGVKCLFDKIGECLEEIWLKDFYIEEILDGDVLLNSNLLLPKLNRLHLIHTSVGDLSYKRIDYTALPSRFTMLTHLTLMHFNITTDDSFFTRFLQTSTFPSLTSLAYFVDNGDNRHNFAASLLSKSLAGQLKNLFLIDGVGNSEIKLISNISTFKRLECLTLLDTASLITRSELPNSFKSLSILGTDQWSFSKELKVLKDWITEMDPKQQIRNLSFPLVRTDTNSNQKKFEDLFKFTSFRDIKLHDSSTNGEPINGNTWEEISDLLVNERNR